jgi:hypothetical protein
LKCTRTEHFSSFPQRPKTHGKIRTLCCFRRRRALLLLVTWNILVNLLCVGFFTTGA